MKAKITFLPWLHLRSRVEFGDIKFIPFRDADDRVSQELCDVAGIMDKILASYRMLGGEPLRNCTIVLRQGNWHVRLEDQQQIEDAVSALFLAAIATNSYMTPMGNYANRAMFEMIVQSFDSDGAGPVTILAKRKDGTKKIGGYDHGEAVFSEPPQCSGNDQVEVETAVLEALARAGTSGSETPALVQGALGFISQAFTDSFSTDRLTELIATATAFEQLCDAKGKKRRLAERFGQLFAGFESKTTAQGVLERPDICIDAEFADVQRLWPLHKKWIHELYQVRSKAAHRRDVEQMKWGWSIKEHLVMGAWAFPLAVKLKLATEGHYVLTQKDRSRCFSVDQLLYQPGWDDIILEGEWSNRTTWNQIVSQAARQQESLTAERLIREAIAADTAATE